MKNDIDFVVTWVDGSDLKWRNEKNKYLGIDESKDCVGENRYRDWNLMRYWFRGVEKFAPWVHKVYFVTCGQKPDWLNMKCEKLVCVSHSEYMPTGSLPTFNSNAIEVGIHRIKNLSEQFVLFNDDFFLVSLMNPNDFFFNGLPCDFAALDALTPSQDFEYLRMNNTLVINKHFSFREVISKNKCKWLNIKDIKSLYRTLRLLSPWTKFPGFRDFHGPIAFTKEDFEIVWNEIPEILENTQLHRFRSKEDNTAWLVRYWRLVEGRFHVKSQQHFGYMQISQDEDVREICKAIENPNKKVLCLNDEYSGNSFETIRDRIASSFEAILPEKSSFEL